MSNFFKDLKLIGKASETIDALNQRCTELQTILENSQSLVKQANQAKEQTESRLNESNNALQNSRSELDELRSKLSNLETKQSEIIEENELLILQLQQVQEELEHYFLEYQELKRESETIQQRLDRVLADNPNYFSYHRIECEPDGGNDGKLHWTITGLFGAGRYWDTFELDTIVEKGIAGFVFKKDLQGASPLAAWPKPWENQQEIACIPTGTLENAAQRSELLKALSTSDWRLVSLLPQILTKALNQKTKAAQHAFGLKQALHNSHSIFAKHIQTKLRYDKSEVIKTVTNPDYENVTFRLINLSIGDRILPEFEFRLGCANVNRDRFGSDPKLEFPLLNGMPQFESWFAESEDDFGPKLEVRFSLPNAMDLDVWNKLKPTDQKLISNIAEFLPEFLNSVTTRLQGVIRPVGEWQRVARDLQQILELCVKNNRLSNT